MSHLPRIFKIKAADVMRMQEARELAALAPI